jgi:hypothetical protein
MRSISRTMHRLYGSDSLKFFLYICIVLILDLQDHLP